MSLFIDVLHALDMCEVKLLWLFLFSFYEIDFLFIISMRTDLRHSATCGLR